MNDIKAPIAKRANNNPIINTNKGEKFAICVFAFVVRSVIKFNGNSIIIRKPDGGALCYDAIPFTSQLLK